MAALELALLAPAAIFMAALFVRNLNPLQYEPAHTAQRVVTWYAGRMWTLWVLLLALPLTVLVTGCATLRHTWNRDAISARKALAVIRTHLATFVVLATTLAATGILAIVVVHMLMN